MASKGAGLAAIKATEGIRSREVLLSTYINEGGKVYTLHRGSSASGLTHYFSVAVALFDINGEPVICNVTYHVAKALGWTLTERNGHRVIKVQGGGMDMGFHLVYSLSHTLFAGRDRAGYILNHQTF